MSRDTFTASVPKVLVESNEFSEWHASIGGVDLLRVDAAIKIIQESGIISNVKSLQGNLYEKKWVSGLRLYFAVILADEMETILLLGSGKGRDQKRAIENSLRQLRNFVVFKGNLKKY